ncbi:MAG: DUF262 domain-containing protein [Bacteroidales bacterium]|jgi:uncharacterized protein with ParB-like and HNH nuclease domain|nr:DUF262 domain-containing protein [Bacteroidales bacterium]
MTENKIELKSVSGLLEMNFFIPAYQRGYRWEERQIIDLLNDILEFQKKSKKEEGEFYCLQPLIVTSKENDVWEVVDGQQRLTTIFILLSYLKDALEILGLPSNLFSIKYETREENCSSKEFLMNISKIKEINKTNIDFYRMSDAFLIIKRWFDDNKPNKGDFCNVLLKTDYDKESNIDKANNVRFIWYPINANDDTAEKPNVTFAKYNQGKIDLTNAELIKAIFYLTDSDKDKKKHQIKIGYEWDDMENSLRKPDFWRFINPSKSFQNHIEFIFDLVAAKYEKQIKLKINKNLDRYWSFYIFNELISKNIKIYEDTKFDNARDFLWDEIKTYYRTFVEWYNDSQYFHLIGFLLQVGGIENSVEKIKELAETNSKSQFVEALKKKIRSHFGEINFNEIGYDDNYEKAKKLLLLFNVITTMNSEYNKFAFDRYLKESWSLEHIHAQQSEEITNEKQQKQLLEEQKNDSYISKQGELSDEINELLKMPTIDQTRFEDLQKRIFNLSSDAEQTIHSIKNLALLTSPDNSCLNNSPFHRKRDKIKQLDEKGSFIPICTKNVFLKYYSKNVEQNVKWDKKDMDAYLAEMKTVLTDYITIKDEEYGK